MHDHVHVQDGDEVIRTILAMLIFSYHMDQYIKLTMSNRRYRRARGLS